jgi:hypothetical protein
VFLRKRRAACESRGASEGIMLRLVSLSLRVEAKMRTASPCTTVLVRQAVSVLQPPGKRSHLSHQISTEYEDRGSVSTRYHCIASSPRAAHEEAQGGQHVRGPRLAEPAVHTAQDYLKHAKLKKNKSLKQATLNHLSPLSPVHIVHQAHLNPCICYCCTRIL